VAWWNELPIYFKVLAIVCVLVGFAGDVSIGKPAESHAGAPRSHKYVFGILLALLGIALIGLGVGWLS